MKTSIRLCYQFKDDLNWTAANETCRGDHSGKAKLLHLDTENKVNEMLAHLPIGNAKI